MLGDKIDARAFAQSLQVPVLAGTPGPLASADEARAMAQSVGYPVMLEPAAESLERLSPRRGARDAAAQHAVVHAGLATGIVSGGSGTRAALQRCYRERGQRRSTVPIFTAGGGFSALLVAGGSLPPEDGPKRGAAGLGRCQQRGRGRACRRRCARLRCARRLPNHAASRPSSAKPGP